MMREPSGIWAPTSGCPLTIARSCSLRPPGFCRTSSGTASLPTSWRSAALSTSSCSPTPSPISAATLAAYQAERARWPEAARVFRSSAATSAPTGSAGAPGRPPRLWRAGPHQFAPATHAVAAHRLRPVHGRLGPVNELPGRLYGRWVHGDAKAGRQLAHRGEDAPPDVFAKVLRQDHRGRGLGGRQYADQLVPPQIHHLLHAVAHAGGEGAQHGVALYRPEAVVDHPEPVETGDDNAERGAVLGGELAGALRPLHDRGEGAEPVPAIAFEERPPYRRYF